MTQHDADLRQLADRLDADAKLWQRRGLLGLADKLREAAEVARGWIGAD